VTDHPAIHPVADTASRPGSDPSWLARVDQFLAASTGRRLWAGGGSAHASAIATERGEFRSRP
jgi:hypothetical protein